MSNILTILPFDNDVGVVNFIESYQLPLVTKLASESPFTLYADIYGDSGKLDKYTAELINLVKNLNVNLRKIQNYDRYERSANLHIDVTKL